MKKNISCFLIITILLSLSILYVNASNNHTIAMVDLSSQVHYDYDGSGRVYFSRVGYMEDREAGEIGYTVVSIHNPNETDDAILVFSSTTVNSNHGSSSQFLKACTIDSSNPMDVVEWTETIEPDFVVSHPSTLYVKLPYSASTAGYSSVHSVYPGTESVRAEYSFTLGLVREGARLVHTLMGVMYEIN